LGKTKTGTDTRNFGGPIWREGKKREKEKKTSGGRWSWDNWRSKRMGNLHSSYRTDAGRSKDSEGRTDQGNRKIRIPSITENEKRVVERKGIASYTGEKGAEDIKKNIINRLARSIREFSEKVGSLGKKSNEDL